MLSVATRRLLLTSIASTAVSGVQGFLLFKSARSAFTTAMASSSSTTSLKESKSSSNGLFLFDFDGVVCDSCDECTVSALQTCQKLGVFAADDENATAKHPPQWLMDKMREIRPAIEVGWQIPVLLSVFLEQQKQKESFNMDLT